MRDPYFISLTSSGSFGQPSERVGLVSSDTFRCMGSAISSSAATEGRPRRLWLVLRSPPRVCRDSETSAIGKHALESVADLTRRLRRSSGGDRLRARKRGEVCTEGWERR